MAGRQLIPEDEKTKRRAEALKKFGEQAEKQPPTSMFRKGPSKGGQFKKAPSGNFLKDFFGL